MRKHRAVKPILTLALVFAIGIGGAHAAFIVDTGPGAGPGGACLQNSFPGTVQWLAAEFNVSASSTVNTVQGWIDPTSSCNASAGTAHAIIYTDGGEVPGTELFSQQFTASGGGADWFGPSGLNWNLAPGTYWVAFEVRPGDTLAGAMPTPSVNPLANEAVCHDASCFAGLYNELDHLDIGVRITAAVPEPSSALLLVSGVLGLAAFFRRKKS